MAGEHVELVEGAVVEQVLDALAGEHLAAFVLAGDRSLGARLQCQFATLGEVFDPFPNGVFHGGERYLCTLLRPKNRPVGREPTYRNVSTVPWTVREIEGGPLDVAVLPMALGAFLLIAELDQLTALHEESQGGG